MRRLARLALVCGVFAGSALCARLVLAQECVDRDAIESAVAEAGAFIAHDLVGIDAAAWLLAWNAVPPVTNTRGDRVVIIDSAGAPTALVVVFTGGCVSVVWQEGRGLVDEITTVVLGP